MPKSLTATKVEVRGLSYQVDDAGNITGLSATLKVAYGNASASESFDLWAEFAAAQKIAFQAMYNKLTTKINSTYLI